MSDLLSNIVSTLQSNQSVGNYNEQNEQIRKTTIEATNSLFEDLLVIYPSFLATIKKNSPEDAKRLYNKTKKMWLDALMEEQINPQMISLGLSKCRKSSTGFMPTIGEFVSWCHPNEQDLGIPMMEAAYIEACQHTRNKKPESYSHIIVYEAGSMTGFFELASSPSEKMRPLFKANYNSLKVKLIKGEQIHIVTNAIADMSDMEAVDPRTNTEKESDRKKAGSSALDMLMGRS